MNKTKKTNKVLTAIGVYFFLIRLAFEWGAPIFIWFILGNPVGLLIFLIWLSWQVGSWFFCRTEYYKDAAKRAYENMSES